MEFFEFIFSGFLVFLGFLILLCVVGTFTYNLIYNMWKKFLSARIIRKQGYPPEHCDVFGDTWNNDLREDDDE